MAFTFWKFENREKWKQKWKFVANYFHSLVSRLTLQSEVDVVDRSDRRMHSTILSLLTDPFPLPPSHCCCPRPCAAMFACQIKFLYKQRESESQLHRPAATATSLCARCRKVKGSQDTGGVWHIYIVCCMLSITSDCGPPLMMINATNCALKFRHI